MYLIILGVEYEAHLLYTNAVSHSHLLYRNLCGQTYVFIFNIYLYVKITYLLAEESQFRNVVMAGGLVGRL